MLYRAQLHLLLFTVLAAGSVFAQSTDKRPVSKSEVFAALESAKEESQDLMVRTNADLIAAINVRGVDFVLTPEEEWQLEMRDASDELLAAIRDAVDPKEREARINADRQQRLYTQFASNYNGSDLASRSAALTAAREFVSLYAVDSSVAEIVTFMQRNLPRLEQSVNMLAQREEAMERARAQAIERQQQMERERQVRESRRRETAEQSAAKEQSRRNDPNSPQNRTGNKEDAPAVRQPTDPMYRSPRIPAVRRP